MNLSKDLISQFVKATKDTTTVKKESTVYGTVVKYNEKTYVKIDGSDLLTPAETLSSVEDGERVSIMIKDHTATITGNYTAPSASSIKVDGMDADLKANTASIKNLVAKNAEIENLVAGKATIDDLQAANAEIDTLKSNYAEIETLVAGKASIGDLEAVNADIKSLKADKADIAHLEANYATIGSLNAVYADVTRLEANKADITDLNATNAVIEELKANKANISDLEANYATIKQLDATNANVTNLQAETANINTALIDKANVSDLNATNANVTNLQATKADVTDLNAANANISTLTGNLADITTLVNGNLTSDNIQSMVITGDKFTVEDGFIKNAMIESVNASKINTGVINTNNVSIQSNDGSMILQGNLQQFKDENGNVRIQIGKDTSGNFTFVLYDENGTGQLINQNGIQSSDAIADGLIVDAKVADNANIAGSKLDIDSVVTEVNNGSTNIKGTKIYLDDQNQTLNVAFNNMSTTVSGNTSTLESHTTSINTMNGEISQLISDTTITKQDGTTVSLKDAYNSTVDTVNSHTQTIGSLETNLSKVSTGQNKWLLEIFEKGDGIDGQSPITIKDIIGKPLRRAILVDDSVASNQSQFDNQYLGRATTYVYLDEDYSWETTATSDDGSTIYLNGAAIATLTSCAPTAVTVPFKQGWNKITWVYNEGIGGDGWDFNPRLTTLSQVKYMNAYPMTNVDEVGNTLDGDIKTVSSKQTALEQNLDGFKQAVSETYATNESLTNVSNNLQNNYSTTTAMNSAINQKANEITSSVSQTYATKESLTTVDNKFADYSTTSAMNSAIQQKANEITSTVSETYATKTSVTDVSNNLKNNYSTTTAMNSAINQKANEITSLVSETYTTKAEFDSLNIGGRNLLVKDYSNLNKWIKTGNTAPIKITNNNYDNEIIYTNLSGGWEVIYKQVEVIPNQEYTLSWEYQVKTDYPDYLNYHYGLEVSTNQPTNQTTTNIIAKYEYENSVTEPKRVSITFKPTVSTIYLVFNGGCINDGNSVYSFAFNKIKLEKGNKATDWTPAPEDIDSAISIVDGKFVNYSTTSQMNSAINQKANEITSTVSETYATKASLTTVDNKFADYSTTSAMNSAINQKANEITSSVSETYATKTSLKATDDKFANYSTTSQMNSAINQKANEITSTVSETYATKTALNTVDGKFANYSTTSDMNSTIQQKANEITSSVSQTYATKTSVTDLSNNLTNNYSTTQQMNSAINQKANEITSTVSETYATKTSLKATDDKFANYSTTSAMNSAINQKANEITSSVSETYATKTSVTDVSNNLKNNYSTTSQMNSAIDQKANAITSTVSETYATKSALNTVDGKFANYSTTSAMNSAINQKGDSILSTVSNTYTTKADFNNLNIGGVNLLTKDDSNLSKWIKRDANSTITLTNNKYDNTVTYTNPAGGWEILYREIAVTPNQEYTLSWEYQIFNSYENYSIYKYGFEVATTAPIYDCDTQGVIAKHEYETSETPLKRVSMTFKPTVSTIYLVFNGGYINDSTGTYRFAFNKVKLEKGNKATDWSPNPNDIDASIQAVDGKFVNYSTTQQMNSAINQKANEITSSVSQTYTTKTDFNNLQVGGTNLLPKSGNFKDNTGLWHVNGGAISVTLDSSVTYGGYSTIKIVGATGAYHNAFIQLKPNTTYTYSVLAKASKNIAGGNSNPLHMWVSATQTSAHLEIFITNNSSIGTKWTKAWVTFKTPNDADVYYMRPFIYQIGDATVWLANAKIEEGNKATDWSPAQADIDASITAVDNKFNNYSTTSQMNSAINQKANEITSTVSSLDTKFTTNYANTVISSSTEFYLSTSNTTQINGAWSDVPSDVSQGTFLWSRTKNTKGDGSVSYTEPICVTDDTSDGYIIVLSRENQTIYCDANGNPI